MEGITSHFIAPEARAVVWQLTGCRFKPPLWVCQSVPEQDTSPPIAFEELVGVLNGSQAQLVCEWVCVNG